MYFHIPYNFLRTNQILTLDIEIRRKVSMTGNRRAKGTAVENPFDLERKRMEARPERLHKENPMLLCGREKGLELGRVGGDGFL